MRILLTTDPIGGVWTFTRELTEHLLSKGYAVALVSFGRLLSDVQTEWCAATAAEYTDAFCWDASAAPLEWMQHNAAAFALGEPVLDRVVRQFRPDILHSSQFCWGALALGVPVVITAHSDVMSWMEAVKPGASVDAAWLARYCDLVQQGLCSADEVVAPTAWMREALQRNFYVPGSLEVIHNGRKAPAESRTSHRAMQAVSVGRLWDEAKGIGTVLEAAPGIPLLIAGEDRFEQMSAALPAGVTALGALREEELFRLFQESSIYIAASLYEPFGLAPLEAALCGCAVVARDLQSLREVWGDAALYFRDAAELRILLNDLAADGVRMSRARHAANLRARSYTAERMADSYLRLYRSIAASNGRGARSVTADVA